MWIRQSGVKFLGFSKVMKCDHCNNETPMQVIQNYLKQSVMLVPLGTRHGGIYMNCPVCEQKQKLVWDALYSSQDSINKALGILDGGKDFTKQWLLKCSVKDREAFLKRLNDLKQYQLVKYLAS